MVTWFTYSPQGEISDQAWLIGSGSVTGNRITITGMVRPAGAIFGIEFDQEEVVHEPWG